MTRSRWKPPKDADELRRRREREQLLADIVSYGTGEDFVAAVKAYKSEVGRAELQELSCSFAPPSARSADFD
jgi:hypothetical protein